VENISPQPGDLVHAREALWRVAEVRTVGARDTRDARNASTVVPPVRIVRVIGADEGNRWQTRTLLEPFDRLQRVTVSREPRVVSRRRWMRTLTALVAASPSPGCPASIAGAQVTLMPHQIEPALAILRGQASRLLLADAVGLGKTIQAALVLRELRARGCADRVLVLVPSGLRDQWQHELHHRAGLSSTIVDAATLAGCVRTLPPDINPWSRPGIPIVSLDFIKQPVVLSGAASVAWDVLIVDEAHGLSIGTERITAVDLLARHSRFVILLSATPHHGSDTAFDALCRIGAMTTERHPHAHVGADATSVLSAATATTAATVETVVSVKTARSSEIVGSGMDVDEHDDRMEARAERATPEATSSDAAPLAPDPIAIFRRTRATLKMPSRRRVHVLRVTPTRAERWLHDLLSRYIRRVEGEAPLPTPPTPPPAPPPPTPPRAAAAGVTTAVMATTTTDATRLALSVLLKRASSSASSLARSLERRIAFLDARWATTIAMTTEPSAHAAPMTSSSPRSAAVPAADATSPRSSERRLLQAPHDVLPDGAHEMHDSVLLWPRAFVQGLLPFADSSNELDDDRRGAGPGDGVRPKPARSGTDDETGESDEFDDPADREPMNVLGAPGLRDPRVERRWLTLLLAAARNAARDESKPRALARWLRRSGEAALVYTEYRDTLEHLARVLPEALDVEGRGRALPASERTTAPRIAILHGGLGAEARREALARFTTGDARVLLTTDAAGEGLNLHQRCRLVFNVELPWNPNRLEQRIGRVDRLGQTRIVHAVHLVAAETAEERMLTRLLTRLTQIATTLGDAPDVLHEPVLHDGAAGAMRLPVERDDAPMLSVPDIPDVPNTLNERSSPATIWPDLATESRRAVAELALLRGTQVALDSGDPLLALDRRAPMVAVVRRRRRECQRRPGDPYGVTAGLICIWRTRVLSADGRAQAPIVTALHIDRDVPRFESRRSLRSFVTSTLETCRDRVSPVLDAEIAKSLAQRHDAEHAWHERMGRRLDAIERDLRKRRGTPVQPLLFEEFDVKRMTGTRAAKEGAARSVGGPVATPADLGVTEWIDSHAVATADRMLALVLVVQ
jgi:superfamily II DNA or RNA helicase